MAEMATYIGIEPRTVIANATISRGTRLTLNSGGTADVQDNTAKGDFVALTDGVTGQPLEVASVYGGGKVPALAAEAVTAGTAAYTNTSGRFGVTTASNVLIGKWVLAASGAGVIGEVELQS